MRGNRNTKTKRKNRDWAYGQMKWERLPGILLCFFLSVPYRTSQQKTFYAVMFCRLNQYSVQSWSSAGNLLSFLNIINKGGFQSYLHFHKIFCLPLLHGFFSVRIDCRERTEGIDHGLNMSSCLFIIFERWSASGCGTNQDTPSNIWIQALPSRSLWLWTTS